MKIISKIFMIMLAAGIVAGCDDDGYLDPITAVEPGDDMEAPVVEITNPTNDVLIPFTDTETDLNFQFKVADDIEVESIQVSLDGTVLTTMDDFKDYRNVISSYLQEDLGLGQHTIQVTATDISGKTTTESVTFEVSNDYNPKYEGEVFYMPFEGGVYMEMINETFATVVGTPSITSNAKVGTGAYAGAADSYLTFPVESLNLGNEFSTTFWLDMQSVASNRAGILVIGPPDPTPPNNNRTKGFRFFREGSATSQTFKLNVGTGTADAWVDGGSAAALNPNTVTGYAHFAFTISPTVAKVYINGTLVKETSISGVNWDETTVLSIGSGAPYFVEWNHLSDPSYIDELRIFDKVLTQQQIQQIIDDES